MEMKKNNIILERYDEIVKKEHFVNYLQARYDSRNSFYKKARIFEKYDKIRKTDVIYLVSYDTIVAIIENNRPIVFGWYSQTTARHINEFLKQNGFKSMTKKEMESEG